MTAPVAPSGHQWLHEIKHDGFRIIARNDGRGVRLYGLRGEDLTQRYPLIVETMARLPSFCTIDGEAIACDEWNLLHPDGDNLTRLTLTERKDKLAKLLDKSKLGPSLRLSDHVTGGGGAMLAKACKLGLEGIVSKRTRSET